ncbi:hypothetical protein [Gellertiella hungarica]|uniref:Uncharacterized protein n=1 Tax=Gellertiella hungarica TaxID=1572859 RepID=A0A7W6J6M4_9HYPH|nr:hypothetical protein [Gellertiella hungarica]MBB4065744.1 hypothetical protein [Gellertiella hungarica]
MATVINLKDRQRQRRPARDTVLPEGGARIYLFTGVRYERYQPEIRPKPTGTSRAGKR